MELRHERTLSIDRSDVDPEAADIFIARTKPASCEAVERILAADEKSSDGRSNWMWVRLANGDLILGVFPQGDTYLECEGEAP